MKTRHLALSVTPTDVKHNPSVRHMLHVNVWTPDDEEDEDDHLR